MELDAAPAYRNASAACDDARAVKDAAEQEAMRASSKVNDDCMAEFEALIRPGITEKEMAEAIRGIYAAHGCSGVSFPPICGFGAHAADPHHDNDDTPLEAGPVRPDRCGRRVSGLLFRYDPDVLYRGAQRGGA